MFIFNIKNFRIVINLIITFCFNVFLPYESTCLSNLKFRNETIIPINLIITSSNTTCQKNNGSIIVQANNGVAPYSFQLNTALPQTSGNFLFLSAGSYNITVTDAIGQTATQSVILTNTFQATSAAITSQTSPTTCNSQDANLTITGSGGTPPYMYSLDDINYQSSNFFPNLTAGAFLPIVKDANGCVSSLESFFMIHQIPVVCLVQTNGESFSYQCNPFRSSFGVLNVQGGVAPYSYSLDGINYQTNNSFYPLVAGFYLLRIKDATGFIRLFSASVVDPCLYSFSINATTQNAYCGSNGIITVNPANGFAPYQYSLDGINFQTNNQFTGLTPGGYTITVKDFNNFINTKFVNVLNSCVQINITSANSTCGNNNGSISASAANGTAPYQYSINGGTFSPSNNFTNLAANSYVIRAKDATGAIAILNTIVNNTAGPQILVATTTATGCSNNTGTISIQTQSGTPPLLFSINGTSFQSSNLFAGLPQNNYNVIVKDANGCIDTKSVTISLINNLIVNAIDSVKICEGKNGSINCTSNANSLIWAPSLGLNDSTILQPIANPRLTTQYFVTGTTGTCTKKDSVIIFVKPAPSPNAGQGSTICFGQDASLLAEAGQLNYLWKPSTYLNNPNNATASVIRPKNTIKYSLSVVGLNGCESLKDDTLTIKVLPPPKVFVGNDTSIAIGEQLTLNAIDVNGSGFNQFEWSPPFGLNDPFSPNPTIKNISTNSTYSVRANTIAGCEGLDTINIKVFLKADIYVPTAFSPNGDGNNDVLRAIPVGIKSFKYFTIFDRYSRKIFSTTEPNKGWNGRTNDGIYNTGSFVWIALGIDFRGIAIEKKGSVILVR